MQHSCSLRMILVQSFRRWLVAPFFPDGCARSRAGGGASHARGRLYAARRHAGHPHRRDDFRATTRTRPSPRAPTSTATRFTPSSFNVGRAYLNVTGQINHIDRVPRHARHRARDRHRQLANGSYVYRLKYAYAPVQPRRLDGARIVGTLWHAADARGSTSWKRLSLPLPGHRSSRIEKAILSSSDFGASFRYNFGKNYGDVHTGFYNGENYNRAEANDQKAFMTRGTLRPLPQGLRRSRSARHWLLRQRRLRQGRRARRGIFARDLRTRLRSTPRFDYLWATDQTRVAVDRSWTPTATRSG